MPYAEQQSRAQRLQEIEAFKLAKLWRVLAQDHDRVSQRVVIARGDRVAGRAAGPRVHLQHARSRDPGDVPVLLLDADHDPLIGAPPCRPTGARPSGRASTPR